MRWVFDLNLIDNWAHDYGKRANFGPDFSIFTEEYDDQPIPSFQWSSIHLESLDDVQSVINRALSLKLLHDGVYVLLNGRANMPLRSLTDRKNNRHYNDYNYNIIEYPYDSNLTKNTKNKKLYIESQSSGLDYELLYVSRYDDVARGILSFLGLNGVSWISLYACLDYVKNKGGWRDNDIENIAKIDKAELKRFKHTANNPAAIGPYARHGDLGQIPPKKPMTFDEADELIRNLLITFLKHRSAEFYKNL